MGRLRLPLAMRAEEEVSRALQKEAHEMELDRQLGVNWLRQGWEGHDELRQGVEPMRKVEQHRELDERSREVYSLELFEHDEQTYWVAVRESKRSELVEVEL